MGDKRRRVPTQYVESLRQSGFTIYDPIEIGDRNLWIPTAILEALLDVALRGISLAGLPLRTRSKVVKEHVCRALGYPVPSRLMSQNTPEALKPSGAVIDPSSSTSSADFKSLWIFVTCLGCGVIETGLRGLLRVAAQLAAQNSRLARES